MNLTFTIFSFNFKIAQDEGRRLQPEAIEGKSSWVYKIIPVLNHLRVFDCFLHTPLIPALKFGLSFNCAKQKVKESMVVTVNATKLK